MAFACIFMATLASCNGAVILGSGTATKPIAPDIRTTYIDGNSTATSTPVEQPTPTRTPFTPAILLSPYSGDVNTPIQVTGSGFPPSVEVVIRLGVPGSGAVDKVYAQTRSDDSGSFSASFAIPSQWPDTREVTEKTIVILAESEDSKARATANYQLTRAIVSTTSPTIPFTVTSTATGDMTTTVVPSHTVAYEPIQVSIDFLNSLLRDPSGSSSVGFLSQRLRAEITNNWVLPTGLGIQPGYNSFEVEVLTLGESSIVIKATLTYESGASIRNFTMIKEGDNWRIDGVVAGTP